MSKIKRFIQTALTYLAGNILSKLVTFFLIPLYTNKLTTGDYGDYDVVVTIITLLVAVAFFQIWDGMFRMSFDVEDTEDKYGIISICFKGYGIGIFVFTGLYTILAFILSFDNAVLAYVFGLFFGLQYMYSFAARVFLRNKLFVFSGVVNTLTIAVVNIVLILCFHMGVESLYIAQIAGCFLQCLIVEIRLHLISNTFKKPFDSAKFKAILKFSIPLCIATVSYWLLSGFTKIIINSVCGSDENGLFAIASSLANVAVIAVNVFQFAWNEMAYLMANEDDRTNTYKKCLDLLFSTVWICCAAFCAGISIIFPYVVGEAFSGSAVVIPYLRCVGKCDRGISRDFVYDRAKDRIYHGQHFYSSGRKYRTFLACYRALWTYRCGSGVVGFIFPVDDTESCQSQTEDGRGDVSDSDLQYAFYGRLRNGRQITQSVRRNVALPAKLPDPEGDRFSCIH